jgi:Bacterial SH3 domain
MREAMRRGLPSFLALGWSLAALPPAAAVDAPFLHYSLPAAGDADVPTWDVGTELYAADVVALRVSPAGDARRLRVLAAGTRVTVIDGAAPPRRESGFLHRWVQVAVDGGDDRGYVFGGLLTPLALRADLDGDGRTEVVTAAFTEEAQAVVRVASDGRPAQSVSFRIAGEAYVAHRGGGISARLVAADEAGVALFRVGTGQEACGDYSVVFVSFLPTAADPVPRPRIALVTNGLSDPPSFAEPREEFDAASRTVTVRTLVTSQDEQGRETSEPVQVVVRRLRDGVYQ